MGNNKELIERLRKHEADYHTGKTQDFCAVCNDCGTAAMEIVELERERNTLKARLEHLLLSETISRYDAKNRCGGYVLEIGELDHCAEDRLALLAEVEELRARCKVFETDERAPDPAVLYICDRRACEACNFECKYTQDIRHAKHFELFERTMYEQEG